MKNYSYLEIVKLLLYKRKRILI